MTMRTRIAQYPSAISLSLVLFAHSCSAFSSPSPWSSASWRIDINFGREVSTEMPEEWGASGARLALPVSVIVGSDAIPKRSIDPTIGNGGMSIDPFDGDKSSTYINSRGEQTVEISGGGWKIELPKGGEGLASTLKICLDLHSELERNDVVVSPDRLYLFAPCWREEEYRRGKAAMTPIVAAANEAQRVLDEQLEHEGGDRRLDGTDPIDTIAAYGDMVQLVADRDEKKRRRREAEKVYPREGDDGDTRMGHWPGSTEPLAIGRGNVLIKRRRLFGEELWNIGRWSAVPVQQISSSSSDLSNSNVII